MRIVNIIGLSLAISLAAGPTMNDAAAKPSTSPQYLARDIKTVSAKEVGESYLKHAALAQYYRWYLLYENDEATVDNAVEILDENVRVKSGLGESKGSAAYRERVGKLPKAWDNAHHVKDVNVTINPDGSTSLVANISYFNKGMLPDGAVRVGELTYLTTLKPGGGLLPLFSDIEIVQNSESRAANFVSEYPHNRVRSLVHYWLALMENPARSADPFRELFADGFVLNFSTGKIDSFEKFKAWYDGPASSIKTSTHRINSLKIAETGPNKYAVVADFDWQGITPNGQVMVGRTVHNWTVLDTPSDRFPKIKTVDVKMLVPFQPKP